MVRGKTTDENQTVKTILAFLTLMAAYTASVDAQSLTRVRESQIIDSYTAWIGRDDLYNSSGARLTKPWQIIRQDRANYHAYGIRDEGDEDDSFFVDSANRQILETMLENGTISRNAQQMILRGNVWVSVKIFGRGDSGDYLTVDIWR